DVSLYVTDLGLRAHGSSLRSRSDAEEVHQGGPALHDGRQRDEPEPLHPRRQAPEGGSYDARRWRAKDASYDAPGRGAALPGEELSSKQCSLGGVVAVRRTSAKRIETETDAR